MIRADFKACREMQNLPPGGSELTRSRDLTQAARNLAAMGGAGRSRPHHRLRNASVHGMTGAAVEMMTPRAAFARSCWVGSRASSPTTNPAAPGYGYRRCGGSTKTGSAVRRNATSEEGHQRLRRLRHTRPGECRETLVYPAL